MAANALCGGRGGGEKLVKLEEKMSEEDHYCVRWKGKNEHEGSEVKNKTFFSFLSLSLFVESVFSCFLIYLLSFLNSHLSSGRKWEEKNWLSQDQRGKELFIPKSGRKCTVYPKIRSGSKSTIHLKI